MRKLLSLLIIAVLSIVLVACSDESVDEPKEVEAEETEVELSDEKKAEIEKKVKEEEEERKAKEYEEELKAEQEAKKKEEEEKAKKEKEEKEKAEKESNKFLEDEALNLMEEHLGDVADIKLDRDEKTFSITITQDEVIHELAMVFNGELSIDNWHGLVDSIEYMANSINDLLGGGYTVEIVNPLNTENVLLIIYDGVILYDVANDL